jgi:hypothetical protein
MVVNKTRSVSHRSEESYRQLLLEVSLFFHPEPEVSYRFVADRLSAFYGGGDCRHHPALGRADSVQVCCERT